MFIIVRFIEGFIFAGAVLQPFIIISELVGNHYRPFAGLIIFVSNPIAWSLMAVKSYYVNNWRTLNILCNAPYIVVLAFYKFVPESIQWQYESRKCTM